MSKPKVKPKTGTELELERRQRTELDRLTRENNEKLKAIKRGRTGERSLFGRVRQESGGRPGDEVQTRDPLSPSERLFEGVQTSLFGRKRARRPRNGAATSTPAARSSSGILSAVRSGAR